MDLLTKDASFEELHDRDEHGRFSKMGAALHAIESAIGKATAHHASGSSHHDRPVVHVTTHEGGHMALSAHDEDNGAFPFVRGLDSGDVAEMRDALSEAADRARGGHDEEHWRSASGGTSVHSEGGHVRIVNHAEDDELEISPDEADELSDAMARAENDAAQAGGPMYTAPLGAGETYVRGTQVGDGDYGVARAVVDTPEGRRVRVGMNGTEERWSAGRGPSTAQLDEEQGRELAAKLREARTRAAKTLKEQDAAWERYEAAWPAADAARLKELTHRRGKLDDKLTPAEDSEWAKLYAAQEKAMADAGAIWEGDHSADPPLQVVTPWGTVSLRSRIWSDHADVTVSVHPNGQSPDSWLDPDGTMIDSDLSLAQASAMAKWLEQAWSGDDAKKFVHVRRIIKSPSGGKKGSWEWQWKVGKLRKKWVGKAHPWTALYRHLRHHMPAGLAKRTAAQWHKDVFGIWPGEKRGKNPVGPG